MSGRRWFLAGAAALAMVVSGAAGGAAQAQTQSGPATVYVESGVLHVVGAPGVNSDIYVYTDPAEGVNVTDSNGGVAVGPGCRLFPPPVTANCTTGFSTIVVDLGDGDDQAHITNHVGYACEVIAGIGNDDVSAPTCGAEGDAGNDRISADHSLSGGAGDDVLSPGVGAEVSGDDGNDTIDMAYYSSSPTSNRTVFGGPGLDTVTYRQAPSAVTVTLDGIADDGTVGADDNVQSDVENVQGGEFNDSFAAYGTTSNSFQGFGGNDLMFGGPGDDVLDGGAGNDDLRGGAGIDSLIGGSGVDICDLGADGGTTSPDCEE